MRIQWDDRVDNVAPDNLVDAALLNEVKTVVNEGFNVFEHTVVADAGTLDLVVPFSLKDNIRVFRDGMRLKSNKYQRLTDTTVRLLDVTEFEEYIIES